MTMMTKSSAINIANLVGAIRPEWDFHGIMAALHRIGHLTVTEAAISALSCAADPEARTPAAMVNTVYRPGWRPNGDPSYANQVRAENVRHRQSLDQIRQDQRNADPSGSHRGYLAAVEALRGGEPA